MYGNPFVAIATLVNAGIVARPPVPAYLEHQEWRKVAMNAFGMAGLEVQDDLEALEALKQIEASVMHAISSQQRAP